MSTPRRRSSSKQDSQGSSRGRSQRGGSAAHGSPRTPRRGRSANLTQKPMPKDSRTFLWVEIATAGQQSTPAELSCSDLALSCHANSNADLRYGLHCSRLCRSNGWLLPIAGDNATRTATLPFSDAQGTIGISPFLETGNGPSRQASPIDTRMSSVSPNLQFARPVHPGPHGRMASIGSVMSQTSTSSAGDHNANLEASIGRMTTSPPPTSPRPT
ncbi:hypothetical protein GX50_08735 [[Emmonsia] crescens]|uniref:Uncharacterized protein n=1 Tax=[Emmonsia] crescens TaxID=73230 RepID=A0A2B7Z4L5_9EURO|nr:hypothetical protein GX50_08735 [Emmonsia crescens]